jgi:hypothetical protein
MSKLKMMPCSAITVDDCQSYSYLSLEGGFQVIDLIYITVTLLSSAPYLAPSHVIEIISIIFQTLFTKVENNILTLQPIEFFSRNICIHKGTTVI